MFDDWHHMVEHLKEKKKEETAEEVSHQRHDCNLLIGGGGASRVHPGSAFSFNLAGDDAGGDDHGIF